MSWLISVAKQILWLAQNSAGCSKLWAIVIANNMMLQYKHNAIFKTHTINQSLLLLLSQQHCSTLNMGSVLSIGRNSQLRAL